MRWLLPRDYAFRITSAKGIQMIVGDGVIVSIQFGYQNYCDNYNRGDHVLWMSRLHGVYRRTQEIPDMVCNNAEVLVVDKYGMPLAREYRAFCENYERTHNWVFPYHTEPYVEYDYSGSVFSAMDADEVTKLLAWAKWRPRSIRLYYINNEQVAGRAFWKSFNKHRVRVYQEISESLPPVMPRHTTVIYFIEQGHVETLDLTIYPREE